MNSHLRLGVLIFLVFLGIQLMAQGRLKEADRNESAYQERIGKEYLYGVYIPADVPDAFNQLNKLIGEDSRNSFKSIAEEEAARKLHFGLGRWMIYNWQFYEGSRLSHALRKMGISHPDDMATFIMRAYHRSLHKNPLEIQALIDEIRERRKATWEESRRKGEVIYEEKRIRPTDNQD